MVRLTSAIERIEEMRLDRALEVQIADLLAASFPVDFGGRSFFQNRPHLRLIIRDHAQLLAHLSIFARNVRVGDEPFAIVGIGEVATASHARGMGYASSLVEAAKAEGTAAGVDFAVLFGTERLYERTGFHSVSNPVRITEMEGHRTGAIVTERRAETMICPLGDRSWPDDPEALFDLAGFAF